MLTSTHFAATNRRQPSVLANSPPMYVRANGFRLGAINLVYPPAVAYGRLEVNETVTSPY